jgi:hypothetical protein
VDADAFRLFGKWLCTDSFHISTGLDTHVRDSPTEMYWIESSACYALSAMLQASTFTDATIDAFDHRMEIRLILPLNWGSGLTLERKRALHTAAYVAISLSIHEIAKSALV